VFRLNMASGGALISAPISGSGAVEVSGGGGILVLGGANTYAGLTTIGDHASSITPAVRRWETPLPAL